MKTILSALLAILLFLPLISAQVANLTFYGVWIGAGPDAIITKVRPTLFLFSIFPTDNPIVRKHPYPPLRIPR